MKNMLTLCWKIIACIVLIFIGLTIGVFDGDVHKM